MTRFYIKFVIACLIIAGTFSESKAQLEKQGFPVIGNIVSEAGPTENARATIFEDGKQIQVIGIDNGGKFNLTFSFNHDYTLVLSGDDRFSKKIEISTFVPRRVINGSPDFPPFILDQNLFKEIKGIDHSFSQNKVLRIFYDPGVDNFISEVFYNDAQIQKQIDNAIWRSQQVGKTAEELSKLTDAELKMMRQEYNQWIKDAGNDYQEGRYQAALMGYKAANRLFPEEQFPKDRIAEINDLLLALQITANLSQVQEEKFSELIKLADSEFTKESYSEAKVLYRQALNIKSNDPHAKGRIQEIDEILARLKAQAEYDELLAEADRMFENSNIDGAELKYKEAIDIRPKDEYPKNQLKAIKEERDRLAKLSEQQSVYEIALADGDAYRDKQQYLRAKDKYEFALSFKANDPVAQGRIDQVNELMRQEEINKNYEKVISLADKSFKKEEYIEALSSYKEALGLKQEELYPKSQIEIINGILQAQAQQLTANEQYEDKISAADAKFNAKAWDTAKNLYAEAQVIKPEESYPGERINEIDNILSELADKERIDNQYKEQISLADNAFDKNNYTESRGAYSQALEIKPKESYPAERISEIDKILKQYADRQEEYDKLISDADKNFSEEKLEDAIELYTSAKEVKPDESYPDEMLAKIDSLKNARIVAEQREQQARIEKQQNDYNQAVAKANELYDQKSFEEAIFAYQLAMEIKPDETLPKQRIDEIETQMRQAAEAQKAYDEAIKQGDRNFNKELFSEARPFYVEAQTAKPDEAYPATMIARIDSVENAKLLAQRAEEERLKALADERNQKYNEAIARGDENFEKEEYTLASGFYENALEAKPDEAYPKQKLSEIVSILSQLAQLEEDYKKQIADADKLFGREEFEDARSAYVNAGEIKPDEDYPLTMIARIDSITNAHALALEQAKAEKEAQRLAEQKRIDSLYAAAVSQGDNQFNANEYDGAVVSYNSALDIKPGESYPKEKISEINEILAEIRDAEEGYNAAISNGDKELGRENYNEAKQAYNMALSYKPDEEYPQGQIEKIDDILEQLAQAEQLEKDYQAAINSGDEAFEAKNYNQSIEAYNNALTFKPGEKYPQGQIDLATKYLAALKDQAEKDAAYSKAIASADEAFSREEFDRAENGYNQALEVKPAEDYPKTQLVLIAERKKEIQLKEQFDGFIAEADKLFGQEKYSGAKEKYSSALNVKDGDTYALGQIAEIDRILGEKELARKLEADYSKAIAAADNAFNKQTYTDAEKYYKEALGLKPGETYPAQQIEAIKRLAENKRVEEEYKRLLLAADGFFRMKEYPDARVNYVDALVLKPEEEYPAKQIERIDELLNRLAAAQNNPDVGDIEESAGEEASTDAAIHVDNSSAMVAAEMMDMYNGFISQADEAYTGEEYNIARFYYYKAIDVRPEELYPEKRLEEIRELINARMSDRREREYQESIDNADKALTEGKLAVARGYYNRSLTAKPLAKYPKMQIALIAEKLDKILNKQNSSEYQSFISQGDKAYSSENYSVARYYYLKAQEMNPSEAYPKEQLRKIGEVLNGGSPVEE